MPVRPNTQKYGPQVLFPDLQSLSNIIMDWFMEVINIIYGCPHFSVI